MQSWPFATKLNLKAVELVLGDMLLTNTLLDRLTHGEKSGLGTLIN